MLSLRRWQYCEQVNGGQGLQTQLTHRPIVTPVTAPAPAKPQYGDVPIKSYVAWPALHKAEMLEADLLQLPGCEVLRSTNQDLLLLVTDTPDDPAEEALLRKLDALPSLQCLSLVAGVTEKESA